VVVAVPHFRNHLPPEAIEEAQRVGLSLRELPGNVPFSEMTREILAKIINFSGEHHRTFRAGASSTHKRRRVSRQPV
jgi:hypothetical protein